MTETFVSAAELMARVLGAEGYPFAVIEHPISSADRATLAARAGHAATECARLLVGAESQSDVLTVWVLPTGVSGRR